MKLKEDGCLSAEGAGAPPSILAASANHWAASATRSIFRQAGALDGGYEVQFVGVRGVSAAVAVIVVASVAQTSCTEKQQTTATNVNIDMIDI